MDPIYSQVVPFIIPEPEPEPECCPLCAGALDERWCGMCSIDVDEYWKEKDGLSQPLLKAIGKEA